MNIIVLKKFIFDIFMYFFVLILVSVSSRRGRCMHVDRR